MGTLGKDLFLYSHNFFEFTVFFGATEIEVEGKHYKYAQLTTAFLNYDKKEYENAMTELQAGHGAKETVCNLILQMPLFCNLYQPERIYQTPLKGFEQLLEDLQLLERYRWFLTEMQHRKSSDKSSSPSDAIEANGLSALVSGRSLGLSTDRDPIPVALQFEMREHSGKAQLYEKMVFTRLADFIYMDFFKGFMMESIPKTCKLCGRYFLQEKGFAYEYCKNLAPDTADKTCREIGALKSFRNKVQDNEVWKIHQRAYKKYYARVMKKKMSQAEFNEWAKEAEKLRDEMLHIYERNLGSKTQFDIQEYTNQLNRF